MNPATSGLAQSVHSRLIQQAKSVGLDPNLVLTRYVTERFLFRLSQSRYAEQFVLKGALRHRTWPEQRSDIYQEGADSSIDCAERFLTRIKGLHVFVVP